MGLDRISDIDLGRIAADIRRNDGETIFLALGKRTHDSNLGSRSSQHRLLSAVISDDISRNLLLSLEDHLGSPLETDGE